MERTFINNLIEWQQSENRKPLIVRGARQVGKTYLIKHFGEKHFQNIHQIDFEKFPNMKSVFDKNLDPKRIISELEILINQRIEPGKDLLFFDEVQNAPKAIMSLRYFYEDMPQIHVIAAGSLLEFTLENISFPVGRVELMDMTPMNFIEFLNATGNNSAAKFIMDGPKEISETLHTKMLELLRQYMFVGGMPECVKIWKSSESLKEVFKIQDNLIDTFRQDFSKYAPYTDKRILNQVLNKVSKNIGGQIKYSQLSDEFTGPSNKKSLELLRQARLIHKIRAASPASLPLCSTASDSRFKGLLLDIGLMRSLNELPVDIEFQKNDLLAMYNGALAEQFVGQELISAGMQNLYYWSREAKSSSAEVDYLITKNSKIYPIEVKGGAAGKLRSMHFILQNNPHIEKGYVLSTASYGEIPEQKLTFIPLYFAGTLLKY
ncbi:MAG: ATP-binding protein [Bacteroidales bacterium]|nr:ATP-binding protein [Bacteroidales bacterium]